MPWVWASGDGWLTSRLILNAMSASRALHEEAIDDVAIVTHQRGRLGSSLPTRAMTEAKNE